MKLTFTLLLSIISACGFAQTFDWLSTSGGTGDDHGNAITAYGNHIYVVGRTGNGTLNFGSTTCTGGISFAKFTLDGTCLWSRGIGVGHSSKGVNQADRGVDITTDSEGNVLVAGYFGGTDDFGGMSMTAGGSWDAFLAKYDSDGNLLWVNQVGGPNDDVGYSIAVDQNNAVYLTGYYRGVITVGSTQLVPLNTNLQLFIARYHSDGSLDWVKGEGQHGGRGHKVIVDGYGNVILSGSTSGFSTNSIDIDPGTFFVKYDSTGLALSGTAFAEGSSQVTVDQAGNLYAFGGWAMFLRKFDSGGNLIWELENNSGDDIYQKAMVIDQYSNVYAMGYYTYTLELDTISLTNPSVNNSEDIFITKIDSSGNPQWIVGGGAINSYDAHQFGGVCLDSQNQVYFTGTYNILGVFGDTVLSSFGSRDVVIGKLQNSSGNPTSIHDSEIFDIDVYPNPTTGLVQFPQFVESVEVFDLQGRAILNESMVNSDKSIDISGFKNGVYLMTLHSGNSSIVRKVLKTL